MAFLEAPGIIPLADYMRVNRQTPLAGYLKTVASTLPHDFAVRNPQECGSTPSILGRDSLRCINIRDMKKPRRNGV